MNHPFRTQTALATLLLGFAGLAQAATAWDEVASGDLSDNGLAPTALQMTPGANTVSGTMGGGGPTTDRDYFSFVVPAGHLLSAVLVNVGTGVSGGSSFFAIQAGPQVTVTPNGVGVENLLAFGHYGNDAVGGNLLADILPPGAPMPGAGTYSIWVQETGGTVSYSFDFVISSVPEPSSGLLLAGGMAALALRRWHRAKPGATPA